MSISRRVILLFTLILLMSSAQGEIKTSPSAQTDKDLFRQTLEEMNLAGGKKICWVGDSITQQGTPGMGNGVGYTTLIQNLYPNIQFYNEGIGGNTTKNIIERIDSIKSRNADLYVIAAGINDARYNDSRGATSTTQYIQNLTTIINHLESTGAEVVLISIFPSFWKDQFSSLLRTNTDLRFEEWNKAAEELAHSRGMLFLDAYSNIKKYINLSNVLTLVPDGVHPNYTTSSGKRLYADSVLYNTLPTDNYAEAYFPLGSHFYKLVIRDNMNPDKLCGIKNIQLSLPILDLFAQTANASFSLLLPAIGPFDSKFSGYYNKPNDYPMFVTFSTPAPLQEMAVTGTIKSGTNMNRGIRNFELYYSTSGDALVDLNHPSWKLVQQEKTAEAVTVNLFPTKRLGVFYMLKMSNSNNVENTVKLKKISGNLPVRVWTQNVIPDNPQYFSGIFSSTGVSSDSLALTGTTPSYIVAWEAEEDQKRITLESFDGSLKNWTLYRSTSNLALKHSPDPSWVAVATGNGDGTYIINIDP